MQGDYMKKMFLLCACALALAGCGGLNSAVTSTGELAPKFTDTKLDKNSLWVRGIAAANTDFKTQTQRRAMSREGAIANAYQRAVEYVKGAGVVANVRIVDAIAKDSSLQTRVDGAVRGGEVSSTEYLTDDGCTVILRVPRENFKLINVDLPAGE